MQGIGGAFLFANSTAILTDAFPANQRGLALGINVVAAIAGSFIGLMLGGVLAPINWRLVFLVSVPIGAVRHRLGVPASCTTSACASHAQHGLVGQRARSPSG